MFLALCALCVVVAGVGCVWKFTDVRLYLAEEYSYSSNKFYVPYVSQARDLSEVDSCDVCMVGDSLTQYGLWDEFFPSAEVVNRGISGDVSEGLVNRLDTIIVVKPKKVFLMIGTNDIANRIHEDATVSNVATVLDRLSTDVPGVKIYLQSVLPRTSKYSKEVESLNKRYEELCDARDNVTYVDMYAKYLDGSGNPNTELFTSDGYHLSGAGYARWIEQIKEYI